MDITKPERPGKTGIVMVSLPGGQAECLASFRHNYSPEAERELSSSGGKLFVTRTCIQCGGRRKMVFQIIREGAHARLVYLYSNYDYSACEETPDGRKAAREEMMERMQDIYLSGI
jgi:hypothetical protein